MDVPNRTGDGGSVLHWTSLDDNIIQGVVETQIPKLPCQRLSSGLCALSASISIPICIPQFYFPLLQLLTFSSRPKITSEANFTHSGRCCIDNGSLCVIIRCNCSGACVFIYHHHLICVRLRQFVTNRDTAFLCVCVLFGL